MSNKPTTDALQHVLANSYTLYLKTQNYHWNVTGPHFRSLHSLFEEQYTELIEANDEIAERIRTLGEKVPASFAIFSKNSNISDGNENSDANDMVKELAQDQQIVIDYLRKALREAENAQDDATCDLLIRRIDTHEKNRWMLSASL